MHYADILSSGGALIYWSSRVIALVDGVAAGEEAASQTVLSQSRQGFMILC